MIDICGRCGKIDCECAPLAQQHPAEWATGEMLDKLAKKYGLDRIDRPHFLEPDDTLRARVQLTIIHNRPWNSGVPGGRILDSQARRENVIRKPGENDPRLISRWMLTVLSRRSTSSGPLPPHHENCRSSIPPRPFMRPAMDDQHSHIEDAIQYAASALLNTGELRASRPQSTFRRLGGEDLLDEIRKAEFEDQQRIDEDLSA